MSNGEMGQVTQASSTSTVNQAEAQQQANMRVGTDGIQVPIDYNFSVEQGNHKVTVVVEQGLNYNFYDLCEGCAWEGRYLHQDAAEDAAKEHLAIKFPSRG